MATKRKVAVPVKKSRPKKKLAPRKEVTFQLKGARCDNGCCMNLELSREDQLPLTVEDAMIFSKEVFPKILAESGLPGVGRAASGVH